MKFSRLFEKLGLIERRCPDPANCGAFKVPKRNFTLLCDDETITEEKVKQIIEKTREILKDRVYEPDQVARRLGKKVVLQTVTPKEGVDESYVYKVRTKMAKSGETLIEVYLAEPGESEE